MKTKEYGKVKTFTENIRYKEQKPILSKLCPQCKTEVYNVLDHINHFK